MKVIISCSFLTLIFLIDTKTPKICRHSSDTHSTKTNWFCSNTILNSWDFLVAFCRDSTPGKIISAKENLREIIILCELKKSASVFLPDWTRFHLFYDLDFKGLRCNYDLIHKQFIQNTSKLYFFFVSFFLLFVDVYPFLLTHLILTSKDSNVWNYNFWLILFFFITF